MRLYQITHFHDLLIKASMFSKIEIFKPSTKNSDYSDFYGILVPLNAEISRSGSDISIPINNHLFALGKCFSTIYK